MLKTKEIERGNMREKKLPFTDREVRELLGLFNGEDDWITLTLDQLKYIVNNEKIVKRIKQ
jgi:hypothetical protein